MFLLAFLFKGSRLIVHNNADIDEKYDFFRLKRIGKYCHFLVFEDYIKEKFEELNLKAEIIEHPRLIIDFKKEIGSKHTVLDLSAGNLVNEDLYDRMSNHFGKENFRLLTNKKYLKDYDNIEEIGYVEDLSVILGNTDYILINNDYRYRVSGLFYLAEANNIKIISTSYCKSLIMMNKNKLDILFV